MACNQGHDDSQYETLYQVKRMIGQVQEQATLEETLEQEVSVLPAF